MKRFYIHKLGCPKNDVDADYLAGYLRQLQMIQVDSPEAADLMIVNTCGFIQPAKEESIEAILTLAQLKGIGIGRKLVVTGCLSQRYAASLREEVPELDGIFGIDAAATLGRFVGGAWLATTAVSIAPLRYPEYGFSRTVDPNDVFAYLKISDGCNNRCSYCAIPNIRGGFRSRTMEAVSEEARYLLDQGKRELILVSQEATNYGLDIYGRAQLIPLLDKLTALDGGSGFWVRVMYLHPARLSHELIDYMIDNPVVCAYFDVPLQHINDRILQSMQRQATRSNIEAVLGHIRSRPERSAIRTTLIVGYPGETEEEFDELSRFVEEQRFDRMGAFVYYPEDDTPAATLAGQLDDRVKQDRHARLMALQQEIAFEQNQAEVGRQIEVLVETVDSSTAAAVGRSRFDAPEIDQTVRLDAMGLHPGDFITATITATDGYDLIGIRGKA